MISKRRRETPPQMMVYDYKVIHFAWNNSNADASNTEKLEAQHKTLGNKGRKVVAGGGGGGAAHGAFLDVLIILMKED